MQTTPSPTPAQYHAYLLRIWQADGDCWQASLQDAATNQRLGFACLEELFAFLMQMTDKGEQNQETHL